MTSNNKQDWVLQFDRLYKSRPFEQFSLLLCNVPDICSNISIQDCSSGNDNVEFKQREALHSLLFASGIELISDREIKSNSNDKKEHKLTATSSFNIYGFCEKWKTYIECTFLLHFPEKKLQLQRLVNKCLEILDKWDLHNSLKNNMDYLLIHMQSAKLKITSAETLRYYQNMIWKKGIGTEISLLYLAWADVENDLSGSTAALVVLRQGLSSNAQPMESLKERIAIFSQQGEKLVPPPPPITITVNETVDEDDEETQAVDLQQLLQLCREPVPSISQGGDALKKLSPSPPVDPAPASVPPSNPEPIPSCSPDAQLADLESDDDQTEKLPLSVLLSAVTAAAAPVSLPSPHPQAPPIQHHPQHPPNIGFCLGNGNCNSSSSSSMQPEPAASLVRSSSLSSKRPDPGTDRGKRKRVSFAGGDLPKPTTVGHVHALSAHQPAADSDRRDKIAVAQSSSVEPGLGPILGDPNRRIVLNGRGYIRLGLLGKGGSSSVYRILSQQDGQVYALKQVECGLLCKGRRPDPSMQEDDEGSPQDDDESDELFSNYSNEIKLLQSLSGCPHIIELIDHHLSRSTRTVSMVLEAGEGDLARLLTQHTTQQQLLDPLLSRLVWRDMLLAVQHIHSHRIVHGDLKPANFVFVRGRLKLIDFGIAKSFSNDTTNIYRESQIGTINYMAPEAICPVEIADSWNSSSSPHGGTGKMRLGRPSDVWSLGCILYQICYGRPPFAALSTVQKLSAIPNPNFKVSYPPSTDSAGLVSVDGDMVNSIQACLRHDAKMRAPISGEGGLLGMPFILIQLPQSSSKSQAEHQPIPSSTATSFIAALNSEATATITAKAKRVSHTTTSSSVEAPTRQWDQAQISQVVDAVLQSLQVPAGKRAETKGRVLQELRPISAPASLPAATGPPRSLPVHSSNPSLAHQAVTASLNSRSAVGFGLGPVQVAEEILVHSNKTPYKQETSRDTDSRPALKALPMDMLNQIRNLQSAEDNPLQLKKAKVRAAEPPPEKQDMRSILERRILEMRKFMSDDQDDATATNTFDAAGFDFF